MYKILIVDDERIERNGIKLLIHKNNLQLDISEAENGRKALEFIQNNPVDILFTDIMMPFMDGLELSEKAKNIKPDIKIIIFSAFGEFEYAKKAINVKVFNYILKPIIVSEFLDVMKSVIALCEKEDLEKEESERVIELSQKGILYEKKRILLEVINGIEIDEQYEKLQVLNIKFPYNYILMVMIDFKYKFYDIYEDFESALRNIIDYEFEYVNLNEHQSIIFINGTEKLQESHELKIFGQMLLEGIAKTYNMAVCVVIGNLIRGIGEISTEYNNIEQTLDNKFFFNENVVLFVNENDNITNLFNESIDQLINDIVKSIKADDYINAEKSINLFFNSLKEKGNLSPTYVKYLCVLLIKALFEKEGNHKLDEFRNIVEKSFQSYDLDKLKDAVFHSITVLKNANKMNSEESNRKVIVEVLSIIEKNFMNDISVEWIAEKVYLTPNYLSYLFKKETGQSLIKYLTSYRLKKAKEFLTHTNMKIGDVCTKTGYTNTSYFSLIFKSYFGLTPAAYREKEWSHE